MDEWNVFDNGVEENLEHKLGDPIGSGEVCTCGHNFTNHDAQGCRRMGCRCVVTYITLVADHQKKQKEKH